MSYVVTLCRRCGAPSYFKDGRKLWRCPYCNHVNEAHESKVIKRVETANEAIALVQELKTTRSRAKNQETFKRASELI